MHCVSCVTIGLIGFVSDSAPLSSHSSMASSYMDVPFYGSITLRMSTRRLSVMLFVFSFRVTVISYYLLRGVLWWPRSFLFTSARRRENCTTFIVFYQLSSSRRLHRLSTNLTACAYTRVVLLTVFLIIIYILLCQFAALFPLVTGQAWLRSDVLEPHTGVTTGESRKFLALGVLDRFPAVPSASLHRLGFTSWLRWLGS